MGACRAAHSPAKRGGCKREANAEKEALILRLFELLEGLEKRLGEVERNVEKTTRHSSKPPSSDGLKRQAAAPRQIIPTWLSKIPAHLFRQPSNVKHSEMADPNAIVLIGVHKEHLDPYEIISMNQCFRILGHSSITFICPEGMNVEQYLTVNPNASFDFIPSYWQSSYNNMETLRILPFLYKRYIEYDYLRIYELDAFVFRDELMEWCRKGYDYIGAPWLEGWSEAKPNAAFIGVGNGGFSLRKTRSLIKAVNSFSYIRKPKELWKIFQNAPPARKPYLLFDMVEKLTIRNNTHLWFNDWIGFLGDDVFWGTVISRNFKWFTVPEPEEALRFSFEVQPRYLYEVNNRQLPFGCHKWWGYDLEFWRPFIREFGYSV